MYVAAQTTYYLWKYFRYYYTSNKGKTGEARDGRSSGAILHGDIQHKAGREEGGEKHSSLAPDSLNESSVIVWLYCRREQTRGGLSEKGGSVATSVTHCEIR